MYHGSSHCPLYLTSIPLVLSNDLVLCSSLHLYKCTLHLYTFCMYMFLDHDSSSCRSRGLVLLTAVPRCLAQCQHIWNTDWLEDRNKVDILWGQSPSLELGHPQRTLDWEMWRFCRRCEGFVGSEFCYLWALTLFEKRCLLTLIAKQNAWQVNCIYLQIIERSSTEVR